MTPEEVILEMNWTFDSDPGRFQLWEQLIKPAMIRYAASLNRQGWTEGFNWKEEYDQAVNEIG